MFDKIFRILCCITYFGSITRFILNDAFGIGRPLEVRDAFLTIIVLAGWLYFVIDAKGTNSE